MTNLNLFLQTAVEAMEYALLRVETSTRGGSPLDVATSLAEASLISGAMAECVKSQSSGDRYLPPITVTPQKSSGTLAG